MHLPGGEAAAAAAAAEKGNSLEYCQMTVHRSHASPARSRQEPPRHARQADDSSHRHPIYDSIALFRYWESLYIANTHVMSCILSRTMSPRASETPLQRGEKEGKGTVRECEEGQKGLTCVKSRAVGEIDQPPPFPEGIVEFPHCAVCIFANHACLARLCLIRRTTIRPREGGGGGV